MREHETVYSRAILMEETTTELHIHGRVILKWTLKKTLCASVFSNQVSHNIGLWWALVYSGMKLRVPKDWEIVEQLSYYQLLKNDFALRSEQPLSLSVLLKSYGLGLKCLRTYTPQNKNKTNLHSVHVMCYSVGDLCLNSNCLKIRINATVIARVEEFLCQLRYLVPQRRDERALNYGRNVT
jgi:hypothetical protein